MLKIMGAGGRESKQHKSVNVFETPFGSNHDCELALGVYFTLFGHLLAQLLRPCILYPKLGVYILRGAETEVRPPL